MKRCMIAAISLLTLLAPAFTVAQHRDDSGRPATGTARPKDSSGGEQKATPREPAEKDGQRRAEPRTQTPERNPRPAARPHQPDPRRVVFVGGYFYDPYFGTFPWWSRDLYPHMVIPVFDAVARIRITRAPRHAAVYVDGFYAGVVDDFDGIFQGLPLPPGGHTITIYLPGYQTITRHVFLSPHANWKLEEPMAPLPSAAMSAPPVVMTMPPPPPPGTYLPPVTPSAAQPPASPAPSTALGTLSLRVHPAASRVTIDGIPWFTTTPGVLVVHLAPGRHRIDVETDDRQPYGTDVDIEALRTTEVNISVPGTPR